MGIGDIRYTVLQVINEVQRKLGLDATAALSTNKFAIQLVDFVNDVCNDLSDLGNWQEMLVTANITAVSGRVNYSINTSANVKNIKDVYFSLKGGALSNVSTDEMRILTRTTTNGTPSQYTIFGTDSAGNPNLRFRPRPGQAEDGELFSVLYYIAPPLYTTSDAATIIPFPGRVVVLGVLAKYLLNESGGSITDRYTATYQDYLGARKEALNRYTSDTGWSVSFTPSLIQRRRR